MMVIIDGHVTMMVIDRTHIKKRKWKRERNELHRMYTQTQFLYAFFRAIQCTKLNLIGFDPI
jgi:hypothetical protein